MTENSTHPIPGTDKIKTLVVDDTVVYRKILSEAVSRFSDLELVGTAPNGALGLKKIAQTGAALVLLDVHMPDMDGVETLARIREEFPRTQVIMVSGISTRGAATTIKALEMGAIDFIRKPEETDFDKSMNVLVADLRPVIRLVRMKLLHAGGVPAGAPAVTHARAPTPVVPGPAAPIPSSFSVLAIGVSTGGPEALNRLIPALPANLPVPVVLVQHMPPTFTRSLAESLDRKSALTIREGVEGDLLKPGVVFIAPGGRHMTVRKEESGCVVRLNDGPPENSCRPSVDVLFRSVAAAYEGQGVISVILTGMGNDGAGGVRVLKRNGCLSITQSASTCVVYGMPRAVDESGLSDISLPLESIAAHIAERLRVL